ncbi:MAG: AMP-binding protein [Microscillaceae bacterium]
MSQTSEIAEAKPEAASKTSLKTALDLFYEWEAKKANQAYLRQPIEGKWKVFTWGQVGEEVRRMAAALKALHLPEKSNIGLVSKNCAHWIMADLAITLAGHISVPFYPSLTAAQLQQVLTHSQCKALFVGKLEVWKDMKAGVSKDIQVIAFPHYPGNDLIEGPGFLHWDALMQAHPPLRENYYPDLRDLRTIIYTSGTTGNPKGVMFDHYTLAAPMEEGAKALEIEGECRFFSYLPMCHIAERALVEGGSLVSGGEVYFAESLDTFAHNLQVAQPTHFMAVPRIWTKFQMGVLSKMPQAKLNRLLKIPLVSRLVKNKIRKGLGLSKARLILTGAAPMPVTVIEWFKKLDIHIQEVYGMTENGGACTVMPKGEVKMGTVGKPYSYVKVKIDEENNEVLMTSPGVMLGYYREPEMTENTFKDGWLRTGDMGEMDREGFLKITGRVKDMFKSAKGEYIVPGPIEWKFAVNNDIEQICVVGSTLPQPIALVVLSELGQNRPKEDVIAGLEALLDKINADLVNYERLHRVVVVKEPWTVENGILTPTLKIKRNVLDTHYQDRLEAWYEQSRKVVFE